MYVLIGSHFVPLEGKFLLVALVIVKITLNVMCDIKNGVSIVQKLVKISNTLTMLFSPVAKTENKRHKMASNYDVHSPTPSRTTMFAYITCIISQNFIVVKF